MITLAVVTKKMAVLVRIAAKIAEGTAGECDECGEPIEPARLIALEGCATHCIICAREVENQERLHGARGIRIMELPLAGGDLKDFIN